MVSGETRFAEERFRVKYLDPTGLHIRSWQFRGNTRGLLERPAKFTARPFQNLKVIPSLMLLLYGCFLCESVTKTDDCEYVDGGPGTLFGHSLDTL